VTAVRFRSDAESSRSHKNQCEVVNKRNCSIAACVRATHERFWMLSPIIVGLAIMTAGVGTGHLVLLLVPTLW
jgi:hypothetical protein